MREQHGFMSLPLMVRANSVIPVGSVEDRPDYEHADGATVCARVPSLGGKTAIEISVARVR